MSSQSPSQPPPPKQTPGPHLDPRRRWLVGSLAGAAALAGVGVAVWRERQAEPAAPDPAAQADIWGLRFDTPDGQKLAMASFKGKPLVLNFWATWCPPCVEELPLIDAFYTTNNPKGWQVVGIAADNVKAVKEFLVKLPLHFPVVLAGMEAVALSKSLGNLSGGLPYTVVFGKDGKVLHRQIGRVSAEQLASWSQLQ
jgi:thiol-disulfide isomerase/thioredoxin